MGKILDSKYAGSISDLVLDAAVGEGYLAEEIIPGLVKGIHQISNELPDDAIEQALDEAATLLADGVESDEV